MSTTETQYVVQKDYATSRMKGKHDERFAWIDDRIFAERDEHRDERGEAVTAEVAARSMLAKAREAKAPGYIRGYRLVTRTVKTTDKVAAD